MLSFAKKSVNHILPWDVFSTFILIFVLPQIVWFLKVDYLQYQEQMTYFPIYFKHWQCLKHFFLGKRKSYVIIRCESL